MFRGVDVNLFFLGILGEGLEEGNKNKYRTLLVV